MEDIVLEIFTDIPQHGQRKRLKTRDGNDTGEGSKPIKRVRGKRGLLKKLVEMPVDILFEIFSCLDPLDLVYMARTTRALRALLTGPSSKLIWKASRSNVFGLPDCPDDLTEQQYAVLMFAKMCMFCQRDLSIVHTSFYARVRCCNKCLKMHFTQMSGPPSSWEHQQDYPDSLSDWIPFIKVVREGNRKGVATRHETYFISSRTVVRWRSEYVALETAQSQDSWLERTLEGQYAKANHSRACDLWHGARQKQTEMSEIFERNTEILQHITEAGLLDDFYKVSPMHSISDLWDAENLSGPIEPTTFDNLKITITAEVSRRKQNRKSQEKRGFLSRRKDILSQVWEDGVQTLPIDSPYPCRPEFYCITESYNLVDYSKTAKDALLVPFVDVVDLWRKHVDDKLLGLIADECGPDYAFDSSTVFDLATTFFVCTQSCHSVNSISVRPSMRHVQALMHRCFDWQTLSIATLPEGGLEFRVVFGYPVWYDVAGCVEFRAEDLEVMQKIVRLCDLDPAVATAREMDELDPIFECLACNSASDGRATMVWSAVLNHQRLSHVSDFVNIDALRILGDPEASTVRARIKEVQDRIKHQGNYFNFVCPICGTPKPVGNFKGYLSHLLDIHGISSAKYEELVFAANQICIPPMYRLWPPLDVNERGEVEEPKGLTAPGKYPEPESNIP
ncbi:hypothetical protein BDN70DRAFT_397879 [Pholiota conissans]|uniref:F-box domain-containing protein n=1 Tax=Pholiota conissans TaxID=109636 RepID=A0A9P5YRE3_9AGAR|nr:hypothetical protein BDN70DRAFT_397879 [Pholiota conissans]